MIPLKDHNPSSKTPFVTYGLLAINVLVFIVMFGMGTGALEEFIGRYALIPADVSQGLSLFTLITSMFLHGGVGHIIGNMLFLNIFGDNLEEYLGHVQYLIFYIVCGLGGALLQIVTDPSSSIPNLGASGAIAGLMGGYLVLFPNHKIDVLMPLGGLMRSSTVPAYMMLFYWIVAQFLQGLGSLGLEGGGVAYFAHIGGFVAGVGVVMIARPFLRKQST